MATTSPAGAPASSRGRPTTMYALRCRSCTPWSSDWRRSSRICDPGHSPTRLIGGRSPVAQLLFGLNYSYRLAPTILAGSVRSGRQGCADLPARPRRSCVPVPCPWTHWLRSPTRFASTASPGPRPCRTLPALLRSIPRSRRPVRGPRRRRARGQGSVPRRVIPSVPRLTAGSLRDCGAGVAGSGGVRDGRGRRREASPAARWLGAQAVPCPLVLLVLDSGASWSREPRLEAGSVPWAVLAESHNLATAQKGITCCMLALCAFFYSGRCEEGLRGGLLDLRASRGELGSGSSLARRPGQATSSGTCTSMIPLVTRTG